MNLNSTNNSFDPKCNVTEAATWRGKEKRAKVRENREKIVLIRGLFCVTGWINYEDKHTQDTF